MTKMIKKKYCQWCGSLLKSADCKVCKDDPKELFRLASQEKHILTVAGYTRLHDLGAVIPSEYFTLAKVHHCTEVRERKEIEGRPISQEDINNWLIDSRKL